MVHVAELANTLHRYLLNLRKVNYFTQIKKNRMSNINTFYDYLQQDRKHRGVNSAIVLHVYKNFHYTLKPLGKSLVNSDSSSILDTHSKSGLDTLYRILGEVIRQTY